VTDSEEADGERDGPITGDDHHHSGTGEFTEALEEILDELDEEDATVMMERNRLDPVEADGERDGPITGDDHHHSGTGEFTEALEKKLDELDGEDATVVMGEDGEPEGR
jgi:hypothetical protein